MKVFTLILFLATYALMIALPKKRVYVALSSAVIFIIAGIVPLSKVPGAISWNVLMMIAGTMVTVGLFIDSKMPVRIADGLLHRSKNVMWVAIYMSLFAGIISAFVDNVATVLMVAPVGIAIAKKLKISPVPMLICISVSSNLQGAATLVGDTTSIMLGAYAKMDFISFFFLHGKPSIFFAVELGALATIPVMMYLFRNDKEPVDSDSKKEVDDLGPTVFLLLTVITLIAASFIKNKPELTNGVICLGYALIAIIYSLIRHHSFAQSKRAIKEVDFVTLGLLTGLFIVIDGLSETGIIDSISQIFVKVAGSDKFLMYSIIVWGSVLLSAFIDNIPYVATMLPVVTMVSKSMGIEPYLLYFGLLSGATLGGNITPIGASANITTLGILHKAGYEVKAKDFMKISVPLTLVAIITGYLFCWFVWA